MLDGLISNILVAIQSEAGTLNVYYWGSQSKVIAGGGASEWGGAARPAFQRGWVAMVAVVVSSVAAATAAAATAAPWRSNPQIQHHKLAAVHRTEHRP